MTKKLDAQQSQDLVDEMFKTYAEQKIVRSLCRQSMSSEDLAHKDTILMRDFKDSEEPSSYMDGAIDSVLTLDSTK